MSLRQEPCRFHKHCVGLGRVEEREGRGREVCVSLSLCGALAQVWTEYRQREAGGGASGVDQEPRPAGRALAGRRGGEGRSGSSAFIAFLSFTGTSEDWALAEVEHGR